jgi:hypothetical protein
VIPHRFVTEYPERCGQLLLDLEPYARKRNLLGSFALLIASAAFTIPYARMTESRWDKLPKRTHRSYIDRSCQPPHVDEDK